MEVDLGVGSSCLISVRMESDQYQFLILFLKYFCPFFFFFRERHKREAKIPIYPYFNESGLQKTNRAYLRWMK